MFSAISRVMSGYSRAAGLTEVWNDYNALQDHRAQVNAAPPPVLPAPPASAPARALDSPKRRAPAILLDTVPRARRKSMPSSVLPSVSDQSDVMPSAHMPRDEVPLMAAIPANHPAEQPIRPERDAMSRIGTVPPPLQQNAALRMPESPMLGQLLSVMAPLARVADRQRAQILRFV